MGSALKFTIDGDASRFDQMWRGVEATIARTSQKVLASEQIFGIGSPLDAEKSRRADQEQAARDRKAYNLRKQRAHQRAREEAQLYAATEIAEAAAYGKMMARKMRQEQELHELTMKHRGAWGGASAAMFISVARDTSASLASGANPITVFMQQMPQVLQAFTMMGKQGFLELKDAVSDGLSKLVSNLGGVPGIGVAAVGGLTLIDILSSEYDMFKALKEKGETAASTMEGLKQLRANMMKIGRDLDKNTAWKKFGQFQNILMTAGDDPDSLRTALKSARKLLPRLETKEEQDAFLKVADEVRKWTIEGESNPTKKRRFQAELERDQALRRVAQMSKDSGIPEADLRGIIQKRYQHDLLGDNTAGARQLTERERIGFSTNSPGLLVANRQLEVQKKIEKNTLDTLKAINSRHGDAVYFN